MPQVGSPRLSPTEASHSALLRRGRQENGAYLSERHHGKLYLIPMTPIPRSTAPVNKSELQDTFLRLDLASQYTGQIAFLNALGLLNNHTSYIYAVASIRNKYAHDISNVMLTFDEYFKKDYSEQSLNQLAAAFQKQFSKLTPKFAKDAVNEKPRFALWLLGMDFLTEIYQGVTPLKQLKMGLLELEKKGLLTTGRPVMSIKKMD